PAPPPPPPGFGKIGCEVRTSRTRSVAVDEGTAQNSWNMIFPSLLYLTTYWAAGTASVVGVNCTKRLPSMMRTVFICWAILDPLPDSKLIQVKLARPLNRVPSALNKTSEMVVRVGCDQAMVEKRAQSAPLRNKLRANIIILPVKLKIFE